MSSLSHVSEVHGLVVSSGFHSTVSVPSHVSEVHRSQLSLEFHLPVSSLSCVSDMHRLVVFYGFIHQWFSRISVISEFTYRVTEGYGLVVSLGFPSLVSSLSHVPEVLGLLISIGFHSPGISLFVCQRCVV